MVDSNFGAAIDALNSMTPADGAYAISASGSTLDPAKPVRGLYVGTAGDVSVVTKDGDTVTFKNVPAGTILPVRVTKVTAGSDVVGLY